jgi:VanZ family protein
LIFVVSSIPHLPGSPDKFPEGTDKLVHFVEYFILSLLLYRGIDGKAASSIWQIFAALVVIGFVIACLDELYQHSVPGRDSSVLDLAADFAGVFTGAAIALYRRRRYSSEG